MLESTPTAGAALYFTVFVVLRYFTVLALAEAEEEKKSARILPRPKSFLLSEKNVSSSGDDVKGKT